MSKLQGAGELFIAKLGDDNLPIGPLRFLGCVDSFNPKFAVEKTTPHYERCTGLGLLDEQKIKNRTGTVDLVFTEYTLENMAFALNGTVIAQGEAETAAIETFPSDDFIVGDRWALGAMSRQVHNNITGLVLKDSATVQNTLVLNEDYTLDAVRGTIKLLNVEGFTQPFVTNAYGYTAAAKVPIFVDPGAKYLVRYDRKNVFDNLAAGVDQFYVVQFDPISDLPLVSDDFVPFSMSGTIIADPERLGEADGQFGLIVPRALAAA